MSVIDIRTRRAIVAEPIAIDDDHQHSRLQRVLKNLLIDSESYGIRWTTIRAWLVNALAYVDAKIVLEQARSKQDEPF